MKWKFVLSTFVIVWFLGWDLLCVTCSDIFFWWEGFSQYLQFLFIFLYIYQLISFISQKISRRTFRLLSRVLMISDTVNILFDIFILIVFRGEWFNYYIYILIFLLHLVYSIKLFKIRGD